MGRALSSRRDNVAQWLDLPCGKCADCRKKRATGWKARLMHEAQCHADKHFLTLTYAPEHLPASGGLEYGDVQAFLKRTRTALSRDGRKSFRFFVCGEYGDRGGRPHWHMIVFGLKLDDVKLKTPSFGESAWLSGLWGKGFVSVGPVTDKSLGYVTKYTLKGFRAQAGKAGQEWVDEQTGEVHTRRPEFARMSLRPGIGAHWFDRYGLTDYAKRGTLVLATRRPAGRGRYRLEGVEVGPLRYYDKRLELVDADQLEDVKLGRRKAVLARPAETVEDRQRRARYGEAIAKRQPTKL